MSTYNLSLEFTFAELAKLFDAQGRPMMPVAVIAKAVPELMDIPWIEANEKIKHRVLQLNSLPAGKSRVYGRGVTPSVSSTEVNIEVIEMLEDRSVIDEDQAAHSGNIAHVRSVQDRAFLTGLGETLGSRMFYGNHSTDPLQMTGLLPRMATASATVIDNGGSGSDCTSIVMVQWGPEKVHGIYPTGTQAGVYAEDKGLQKIIDATGGAGAAFYAWESQFKLQPGLVVNDPRNIAAVRSIEVSGADFLFDFEAIIEAQVQMRNGGKDAIAYCGRKVYAQILIAALNKENNNLTMANVFGDGMMPTLNGMPVRMTESIVDTEDAI